MRSAERIVAVGYVALLCGLIVSDERHQAPSGGLTPSTTISSFCFRSISPALPSGVLLPNLEPWGLAFASGRQFVSECKPAVQFSYTTDNSDLGPVTLFVTDTWKPDIEPTFDKREGFNVLYWRHRGHGYYIVGGANKGWMWNLKNDIGYQLKAL